MIHCSPLYNNQGIVIGAIESIRDITEPKRTEEELLKKNEELNASYEQIAATEEELRANLDELARQESENRFRLILETLPIGFWLADREGRLLLGNPAGERIWGAQHHVGQEEYGIFKAWRLPGRESIRPDDWALGYAVNEGRTTTEELLEIEALNGTHKFILNWAAPVKKEDGEIISAFVIN